jgi:ATP-dependent Clp protease ATP-binding subunit ClpA
MIDKGIHEKDKPILSMMFLGPSGVGKTTIANIIGDTYFGEENSLYLNMACYQDAFGLSKLIAHSIDNTSPLVRKLKTHPKCILIIDEIEKASNESIDLFLNILDQGFFESSKGEKLIANLR